MTNTTYVAQSITEGDQFARAFHQGDYFKLDILGYSGPNGAGTEVGDVPFYLADIAGVLAPAREQLDDRGLELAGRGDRASNST